MRVSLRTTVLHPNVLAHPLVPAIADAARQLNQLRENWLNPPDLVHRVPEVVAGFPDRILPNDEKAAAILKKRTLTNLYNTRPTWLENAHAKLDAAVAAAYGFPPDITGDEALTQTPGPQPRPFKAAARSLIADPLRHTRHACPGVTKASAVLTCSPSLRPTRPSRVRRHGAKVSVAARHPPRFLNSYYSVQISLDNLLTAP